MKKDTYQSIQDEIKAIEKDARIAKDELETRKRLFINDQTFTGKELKLMRNLLKNERSSYEEPNLDYILERILDERK